MGLRPAPYEKLLSSDSVSKYRGLLAVSGGTAIRPALRHQLAGGGALAAASATPAMTPLPGSTIPFASPSQTIGDAAGTQKLSIQVWLRPEEAAVESFARAVSTPGRGSFCHYLSPAGYASGFGPSDGQAATVESWLSGMRFAATQASPGRSYVRATATTSAIDAALDVRLKFSAPPRRPTSPRFV